MKVDIPKLILEESLEALLLRVRWYTVRHYTIPNQLKLAFNYLCAILAKPDEKPWHRIT